MNEHIPNTIRDGLTTLVENLDTTCGSDLVSVVLYDGLVKNTQIKETDTIKVMLVMENIDTGILDQLAQVFSSFSLKDQLQPLVLSEADLRSSTDVFPIKFLEGNSNAPRFAVPSSKEVLPSSATNQYQLLTTIWLI